MINIKKISIWYFYGGSAVGGEVKFVEIVSNNFCFYEIKEHIFI